MSGPSGEEASPHAEVLASGLLAVVQPSILALTRRLLELQESQALLVETVHRNADEFEQSAEWQQARATLERVPEYLAKAARIRKATQATQQLLVRAEKGAAALRGRLEERDRERAQKKVADAAAFGSVAQR